LLRHGIGLLEESPSPRWVVDVTNAPHGEVEK
jgi:hypothetical protein